MTGSQSAVQTTQLPGLLSRTGMAGNGLPKDKPLTTAPLPRRKHRPNRAPMRLPTKLTADQLSSLWVEPLPYKRAPRGYDDHHYRHSTIRPTIFVDGEGANVGELITRKKKTYQLQNYALLSATFSTGEYRRLVSEYGTNRLSTEACLDFLLELPKRTHTVVGYGIDYDVWQMLYDLPEKYVQTLKHRGSVRWKRYCITYTQNKCFSVSIMPRKNSSEKKRSMTWWDIVGFFQMRFDDAAEKWGVIQPEDYVFMARMKDKRNEFAGITDEIIEYNKLEGVIGCRIFEAVRDAWVELGLSVTRFDGAGAVASAMFRKHKLDDYIHQRSPLPIETALRAYIGGRFDRNRLGFIGDGREYDINSAYPYAATELPCLACSDWVSTREYAPFTLDRVSLWHVRWDTTQSGLPWAPFPYRTKSGDIRYYSTGEGWYYGREVDAALSVYRGIQIIEGYIMVRRCEHEPFEWIKQYYAARQNIKTPGPNYSFAEKVIKLGLNSVYGKLAQSKGRTPKYQQLVWAGMITSHTRALIMQAIGKNPHAIAVTATDAVISTEPLDLPTGTGLGEWECKDLTDIAVIGNGLYDSANGAKSSHRGYVKETFSWDYVREQLRNSAGNPFDVPIRTNLFFSHVQASIQHVYHLRCTWEKFTKTMVVTVPEYKRRIGEYLYPVENPSCDVSYPARIDIDRIRVDDGLIILSDELVKDDVYNT